MSTCACIFSKKKFFLLSQLICLSVIESWFIVMTAIAKQKHKAKQAARLRESLEIANQADAAASSRIQPQQTGRGQAGVRFIDGV